MSTRVTAKEWQKRVAAWKRSGKSAAEYGMPRGISPRQLQWWSWHLRKRRAEATEAEPKEPEGPASEVTFLPVRVRGEGAAHFQGNSAPVEVVARGGIVVRVRAECDARWLATLVGLLGQQEAEGC